MGIYLQVFLCTDTCFFPLDMYLRQEHLSIRWVILTLETTKELLQNSGIILILHSHQQSMKIPTVLTLPILKFIHLNAVKF